MLPLDGIQDAFNQAVLMDHMPLADVLAQIWIARLMENAAITIELVPSAGKYTRSDHWRDAVAVE
jgi:hypothetical protein